MQGILYEEASFFSFVFVTLILGGGTAWMTGRACAITWRPVYVCVFYLLLVGFGVRFIHFSVFEAHLLTLQYYLVDAAFCLAFGLAGYRYTRANQMVTQYYWLYEKSGLIGWRGKA